MAYQLRNLITGLAALNAVSGPIADVYEIRKKKERERNAAFLNASDRETVSLSLRPLSHGNR